MAVAMVTAAVAVAMEVTNLISPTHMNSSLHTGNRNRRVEPQRKLLHRAKQMQLLILMRYMAGTKTIVPCGIRRLRSSSNSKAVPQAASLPQEVHEHYQMIPHGDGDAHAAETRGLMLACMTITWTSLRCPAYGLTDFLCRLDILRFIDSDGPLTSLCSRMTPFHSS